MIDGGCTLDSQSPIAVWHVEYFQRRVFVGYEYMIMTSCVPCSDYESLRADEFEPCDFYIL